MSKLLIGFVMLSLSCSVCFAGGCERWEYAKLKDETRKELSDEYCRAAVFAATNSAMAKNANDTAKKFLELGNLERSSQLNKEAYQISMDQVSCMKQVEDVEAMLMRRFKAKPPAKCQRDYQTAIPPSKG